ncbi:MAG: DNA internalization-related competence protein ComEC/Rec2 [Pyrinomonadaceae bacterium]
MSVVASQKKPDFSHYPLAWLAVFFALGIFIGNFFAASIYIFIVGCLLAAISTIIFFKQKSATVFLVVSFAALGAMCLQIEKSSIAPDRLKILYDKNEFVSGEPIEITGVLQGKPELAVGGFFLELKSESVTRKNAERKVSGNIRLFAAVFNEQIAAEYEQLDLHYGARLRVACELRREDRFLNPGVASQKAILDQKELDASGVIKSPLLIENLGETKTFAPLDWFYESRQNLILEFKKYFSVPTAGVLIASLLGNRFHLDKTTAEKFRQGGTFHIVVISGLQITFIGGLAIWILRRFTKNRWAQFLSASVFLWIYTITVGADVPVARAALMFTILHFARVIFRQSSLLNALGVSALILLVWRPSDLFDQSFQLTFVCVTAIIAMAFPLLEKMRAIGEWHPNAETPVPPNSAQSLKIFCETLYWSEANWRREQARSVWQCNLFKTARAEKLEQLKIQKILRYVFEMITVSVIVQAWLVPFLVIYFHRLSLISVFLNIWVGFLMAIESVVALLAVLFANISGIFAAPFIWLTEILNWFLLHLADPFIENDWASIRLPHYAGNLKIIYAVYFIPIIILTILIHCWKPFALKTMNDERGTLNFSRIIQRSAFIVYLIFLAGIVFHPFSAARPDGRLRVEFLDVGQGDSALITMPTGETLMVDGGGKPNSNAQYVKREDEEPELFEPDTQSIGESVVSPFLWEKGLDKVDYILATHADTDHIQGLTDVARNFRVKAAMFGRTPSKDADFAELFTVLQKRGIPLQVVSRGEILEFGDVKVEVLYPIADDAPEAASDNNHSVVLRVNYGARKFLLTGDIEKEAENELLDLPESIQTDVVKVAHHGSRTSSTQNFVNASKARLSVISVGRESPFGHPKPEIVERWKNASAKVLTTGENGTISLSTDGRDLQMRTFIGKVFYR